MGSCAVEFTFAGSLFLLAQEKNNIQKGSAVTISYLDASLGAKVSTDSAAREKRKALLSPYGFECACSCCVDGDAPEAQPVPKKRRRKSSAERSAHKVAKMG